MSAELSQREWVFLDAGGTLISLDYDRVRHVLEELGQPSASDEDLDRAEANARRWADAAVREQQTTRELWQGYFSRLLYQVGAHECAIENACGKLWVMNQELGLWRRPVDRVHDVLDSLAAAGKKLAVISNAEGQVEADLEELGLTKHLAVVIDSHVVGVAKPDPRIFEIAFERTGANPAQSLYVGDVPAFDVEGARAAGLPCVLIDPHGVHADQDVPRIRRLSDLPDLLGATSPQTG